MRRIFSSFALLLTAGCSVGIQVGTDGTGGSTSTGTHTTSSSSTGGMTTSSSSSTGGTTTSSSSSTGGTTTSSSSSSGGTTTSSSSSSSTSTSSGGGGSCWDGNPVSGQGGPCGGTILAPPPTCATGLVCVQGLPDATGTCAPSGTMVSPLGGQCGGFNPSAKICDWNSTCEYPNFPDASGICVPKSCSPVSGCTAPIVTVEGDGLPKQFDASCSGTEPGSNTSAASGYIGYPTPHWTGPEWVWVAGCSTAQGNPLQGSLKLSGPQAMVGSTMTANVQYDSGTDTYANNGTATLTVTKLSADTVRGTYDAVVTPSNGNGTLHLTGSFQVCRGPDFLPP